MSKAKRAVIQIASIEVEVFQLPMTAEYVMSQSQVAKAVDRDEKQVRRFVKERENEGYRLGQNEGINDLKAISSNGYRVGQINFDSTTGNRGGNGKINIIPINLASDFWFDQAMRGNPKAKALTRACMEEVLKRRCDRAFQTVKSVVLDMMEEEYERETAIAYTTWMESRQFLKDAHSSFTNCCLYNGFHAAVAHDKITQAVCGKTASELRELELIHGSDKVGLNHIPDKEVLTKIAQVKLDFSRQRVGNVHQRIKKALATLDITEFTKGNS